MQNYLIDRYLDVAGRQGWPVQIHTGMLAGWLDIRWGDPKLLQDVMRRRPETKFDIFHTSWPFWQDLIGLAKVYPNCHVNMCWTHIMSPSASRAALSQLLDTVPLNKILLFGADYAFVEPVYGHLQMALDALSAVLAEKVGAGYFSMDEALDAARYLVLDGPTAFYGLHDIIESLPDTPGERVPTH